MMKPYGIFALLIIFFGAGSSHALELSSADGWSYYPFKNSDSLLREFAGNADAILIPKSPSQDRPLVQLYVRERPSRPLDRTAESWRSEVFKSDPDSHRFVREQVILVKGVWRYLAELTTDTTGTGVLIHSSLMATIVDGRLHVLLFEAREEAYKANRASVIKLFNSVELN